MTIHVSSRLNDENILDTGSVVLEDNQVFSTTFEEDKEKATIEFVYASHTGIPGEPAASSTEIRPNDTLRITLVNWRYNGINKTQFATINGKALYFAIGSTPLPPNHILTYTFTVKVP